MLWQAEDFKGTIVCGRLGCTPQPVLNFLVCEIQDMLGTCVLLGSLQERLLYILASHRGLCKLHIEEDPDSDRDV